MTLAELMQMSKMREHQGKLSMLQRRVNGQIPQTPQRPPFPRASGGVRG